MTAKSKKQEAALVKIMMKMEKQENKKIESQKREAIKLEMQMSHPLKEDKSVKKPKKEENKSKPMVLDLKTLMKEHRFPMKQIAGKEGMTDVLHSDVQLVAARIRREVEKGELEPKSSAKWQWEEGTDEIKKIRNIIKSYVQEHWPEKDERKTNTDGGEQIKAGKEE